MVPLEFISSKELLQSACTALENANWELAKKLLGELLIKEELPEVLEKYAWATWWLGEEQVTLVTRERAYKLYRKKNDHQSAARTALWIASDHLDFRGDTIIANGWRQRAARLLQGQDLMPEHGWLALQLGAVAIEVEQDPTAAIKHARKAVRIGRKLQVTDLEVIGMAMQGLAKTCQGNIGAGMLLLDEAGTAVSAGEVQELYTTAWTFCYMIYACERIRDVERIEQWCEKMKELSHRINFKFTLGICRAHYAGALILQGKWIEAETELQGSLTDLMNSRPPYSIESIARLGELRRRQGRFTEAQKLFDQAAFHPLAILGKAGLMIEKSANYSAAGELVDHYLRMVPDANKLQLAPALELKVRILAQTGVPAQADEVYQYLKAIVSSIDTLTMRGSLYYTGGSLALCKKDHEEARQLFQDAVYCFSKCSVAFEASMARLGLARALSKLGRGQHAQEEARIALDSFIGIGAHNGVKVAQKLLRDLCPGAKRQKIYLQQSRTALSKREVEVLRLVADGKTDKQIAYILVRSEHTVHRHISNILLKLNVSSRSAAVAALVRCEVL
jgi:LuxR family transcriptional regulator, maltose regulon positive regulatory protein